ncbi:RNA polymerase Rpb5 [Methanosalsum zhilinae DSM 4017]|uniref:DNA-directed RNA polymerase subunit Rpo5 n=1 Tax=Methanosalsum zhilinae (strain DSM 4017 / NBRC 107636 / OCM 62 / WeN5) TaxID=679901 RepID=F7XQ11_METZD|nr:DNA-directed RNA polymerase subunit H [Methanosalsum zhilinae]AEH60372.1 RNA polymerase Rpb5 [Methanosalsum zhilinae DSM 4017]
MKKFSLLDHERIPKHEIMAEDEIKSVLKEYDIEKEQLPKIKANDPVVKEIDASVGDVVKITRISPTAGKAYYYRLVID